MDRVLITGCSSGIGRATALEMTKRGYEVVATARRPETLEGLDVAQTLQLDVVDDESVRNAVSQAGHIDILINNAAWEVYGPAEEVPPARVLAMFDTNVIGPLRMIQGVVPGMRAREHGTIVNISSGTGIFATPLNGAYSATKHALEALSEALRYELAHWGIEVVVIEPGEVKTAAAENAERFGDDGPYAPLLEQRLSGYPNPEAPGPETVTEVIIEAIETKNPKFRWPVHLDHAAIEARRRMDHPEWERAYRAATKLDW